MKRIVYLTCIGSLALALTAWGAPRGKEGHRSARGGGARSAHVVSPRSGGGHSVARVSRAPRSSHVSAARTRTHAAERRTVTRNRAALGHERNVARTTTRRSARADAARAPSSRVASREARTAKRNRAALNRERNLTRANAQRTDRVQAAQARNTRVAQATRNTARRNLTVNRQRNLSLARNVLHNRAGNVRVTNNWRNGRFNNSRYAAFYNYRRGWHNRDWWHHHFTRVVFVGSAWWAWGGGYWYPAWGYDSYASYPYDGPIYTGYADLTPDRVIVNVQVALRDQGYYVGATDGVMGSQTRAALAAFQSDNGLEVTSAVDQPTLQTLGVA
jgi:putative peptidoglycan binding protein